MRRHKSNLIPLLFICTLLLVGGLACRGTVRERTPLPIHTPSAVAIPADSNSRAPAETETDADIEALQDELDTLLEQLIYENDQADDLSDIPELEN